MGGADGMEHDIKNGANRPNGRRGGHWRDQHFCFAGVGKLADLWYLRNFPSSPSQLLNNNRALALESLRWKICCFALLPS
jgi:hypothetical protein